MTLLRRIAGYFVSGAFAQLVGIAAGIVQAHTLGPAGKSVLAYASIGLAMVLTASDGLTAAVLTQTGRDRRPMRAIRAALLRVTGAIGGPTLLLMAAVGIAFPSQRPLIGAACAIPLGLYVQGSRGMLLSAGRTRSVIVQGSLNTIASGIVLIALLAFAHLSAYGALAVWISGWAASAAYGMLACRGLEPGADAPSGAEIARAFGEQLRRGLKNSYAMLAAYLNLRINVFLVSAILGARELGIYTLAIASGELLWNLGQPIAFSALDRVAADSLDDAVALVARLTRNFFALMVALGVLAFTLGPMLIDRVYGPRFHESGLILRILLPGLVVYAARILVGYFIMVRLEQQFFLMWTQLASAALCATITLATFSRLGLAGAALATTTTYLVVVVVLVRQFCKETRIAPAALFIPTIADLRWFEALLRRFPYGMKVEAVR